MSVYAIIKLIIKICIGLAGIGFVFFTVKRMQGPGRVYRFASFGCFLAIALLFVAHFAVSVKQYSSVPPADYYQFEITSEDLHGMYWDVKISHDKGDDLSPQLSWNPIEGATCYAVYMIDPDGNNWIHMKTLTTETNLETGAVEDYIGPYPPSGSHRYFVYVFALREEKKPPKALNAPSSGIDEITSILNTGSDSDIGNVIAWGGVAGMYPVE
ncbi:MAG: hypothetical protein J6X94_11155 [Lachnospiraceae bacterium]|nr:hypothetical protein [Lachnospiraceae bacterium]